MQGLIMGGGIGGLATALALQQHGLITRVFDRKPVLEPQGAGLVLAINAIRVLDRMKLADDIYGMGNELNGMNITDVSLNPISKNVVPYFLKKYGYANVAIQRSALQTILMRSIKAGTLEPDKNCIRLQEKDRQVIAAFADGMTTHGDYAIAADGIHSAIRKQLFPEAVIRDVKQICWRGVLDFELPTKYLHHAIEAWGKGRRFGFVRLDENKVYWYAVMNKHIGGFDFRADLKAELNKQFLEFVPLIRQMIVDTPIEKIIRNDLMDLKPMKSWYTGRTCLLGDAAHAATPNLGQGACQAIEDAWVMGSLMDQYKNPVYAFPVFQQIRKAKADYVAGLSYRIGQMSQYENKVLVGLRNQLMRVVPQKFTKRQFEKLFALNHE